MRSISDSLDRLLSKMHNEHLKPLATWVKDACAKDDGDHEVGFKRLDEDDEDGTNGKDEEGNKDEEAAEPRMKSTRFGKVVDADTGGRLKRGKVGKNRMPVWITAFFASPHYETKRFAWIGGTTILCINLFMTAVMAAMIQVRSNFMDAIALSISAKQEGGEALESAKADAWVALSLQVVAWLRLIEIDWR